MKILSAILVIFSLLTLQFGIGGTNGAPQEAAAAGIACALAIFARIAQATQHHQEHLEKLSKPAPISKPDLGEPGVIVV